MEPRRETGQRPRGLVSQHGPVAPCVRDLCVLRVPRSWLLLCIFAVAKSDSVSTAAGEMEEER